MDYREIPEDKILKFPSTAGFKGWKSFFTDESTTHPAKMNLRLLSWIIETYTSPRDLILDPMAGTGSTVILAALMGRHGIAVEYEPKFCEMIRENIKRTERQSTLTPKGRMICIQGDARELSKLFKETDAIITSPPYGEAQSGGGIAVKGYDGPKHSPTDLVGERSYMPDKFEGEGNISRLKYGKVDAVITSPPYEATCLDGRDMERRIERLKEAGHDPKDFIGGQAREVTLKNYDKVDAVVSSPPYGNRLADDIVQDGDEARMSYRQAIDNIVTSPPYEGVMEAHRHPPDYLHKAKNWYTQYSEDPENIGSMKGETYLEAMLQVYRECHKVLKNNGVMAIVIKNFIRDKAVVRLDLDTIRLAEAVGFTLKDRWYFKLPTKSFWRILYSKKYPNVPEVEYEDILIFTKEAEK